MAHRPASLKHTARSALLRQAARPLARRAARPDNEPPQRILLIRPDHLGDVLWLTPALHGLRERYPDASITVAVGLWSAPILAHNPDLDALLPIAFPGFERRPKHSLLSPYQTLLAVARDIRRQHFDAAVILRDDHWWGALLAAAAGIPRRFGYATPDVAPFLTDALSARSDGHAARDNIALLDAVLRAAGKPTMAGDRPVTAIAPGELPLVFAPGLDAVAQATALLARLPDGAGPIVAIHPSAGVPVKLWDEGRLAAVADWLATEYAARIVLTGSPGDAPLTAAVAGQMTAPALDLTGETDIATLVALYRHCALVLGPDSGALHLAVAAGTPTIHLFGPADPWRFGPWGDPARHLVVKAGMRCTRCGDLSPSRPRGAACMLAITVEDVAAAVVRLFSQGRAG
ncbi:MAG: glycosyltransferase family 9 protein [Thermomicrobiales bacterium]